MQTETDDEAREWMLSIRMHQIESQREKLSFALSELSKDYDSVAVRKQGEKHAVLAEWGTLVFLAIIFQGYISVLVEGKHATLYSVIPGLTLQGVCLLGYVGMLVYCLHHTFAFLFRCGSGESNYAEREKLYTYAKEEAYLFSCMQKLRGHLKTLERIELALKTRGDITEEQEHFLSNPTLTRRPPYLYTNKSVWFFGWLFRKK